MTVMPSFVNSCGSGVIHALPTDCKYIDLFKYFPMYTPPPFFKNVRCWEMFQRIEKRISQPGDIKQKRK